MKQSKSNKEAPDTVQSKVCEGGMVKHKKVDRETIKALALAKIDEGLSYRDIGRQLGVSAATVYRMRKEDTRPGELDSVKRALAAIDLENLEGLSYTNKLVIQKVLERLEEGEADEIGLQALARLGVDVCKSYGIITDKVFMREGGVVMGHQPPSMAAILAAALAKAEMDRQATARIEAETKAYEALQREGKAP